MKLRGEAGYTLAELLVVLALLGIMAVLMGEGMRFGGRVWETVHRKTQDMEAISGGQALLRTVLQRIVPRSPDPTLEDSPELFSATASAMSFTAFVPAAMDASGLARVDIRVVPAAGGQGLVMSWSPLLGPARTQQRVLVSKADNVALLYARRDAGGVLAWQDTWRDPTMAPDLIRIRITGLGRKPSGWPDLLVRPRISRDPTCSYDPVSFGCRNG